MRQLKFIIPVILSVTVVVFAKIDLSTLPANDTVQLTIYNSADLTLVRDARALTLKEGLNQLQFSWANTLIDPTSLEMLPKARAESIQINELVFPPQTNNLGLWRINSEISGRVPVEIAYLTSGLTWRAFYMGTLAGDEKTMRLQAYIRVTNNSGEDYENAQTRLIVGKVHILDEIAQLARRPQPYGSPILQPPVPAVPAARGRASGMMGGLGGALAKAEEKQVVKEGLSEYFLYTIEGTETIPTGWSKRLPSFEADGVPVVNLYKYEEDRYGSVVVRFLSFKNDKEHKLGETPIPDGMLRVYRNVDEQHHLSYEGRSGFKYIPVNEKVELNLGRVADVVVEPKLMKEQTENYRFNNKGDIIGWDQIQTWQVELRNTRDVTVKIEIKRNFDTQYWDLKNSGDYGAFEKEDLDTVKYTITLKPQSRQQFGYVLRTYQGSRQEDSTQ